MNAVLFRVDAGIGIGHGHVFRCLTLAKTLREYNLRSLFVCKDHPGNLSKLIQAEGFRCDLLHTADGAMLDPGNYASWVGGSIEADAEATERLIGRYEVECEVCVDVIVVDHYGLNAQWEASFLARGIAVWAIDDLACRPHTVTGLIDSGIGRQSDQYAGLISLESRMLGGPDYALLRPEFAAVRGKRADRSERPAGPSLLIMFGGVDRQEWSYRILKSLQNVDPELLIRVQVLIGNGYVDRDRLEGLAATFGFEVSILQDIDNVADVMLDADLCVGGGGGAAWERCCVGLPTIMLQLADNQAHNCCSLEEEGAAVCIPSPDADVPYQKMIMELLSDSARLAAMSSSASRLVDGYGARRVASQILGFTARDGKSVFLRPVEVEDRERIYDWQSQPGNRRYFRNPEVPSWGEHYAWFQAMLGSAAWNRIIVHHRRPVGLIRLLACDGGLEVSVLIAKRSQGAGVGGAALQLLVREKADEVLYAEIHSDNIASVKLFESLGFQPLGGAMYRRDPLDHLNETKNCLNG